MGQSAGTSETAIFTLKYPCPLYSFQFHDFLNMHQNSQYLHLDLLLRKLLLSCLPLANSFTSILQGAFFSSLLSLSTARQARLRSNPANSNTKEVTKLPKGHTTAAAHSVYAQELIFLHNSIRSILCTFLCKRKQFWSKNSLLISPRRIFKPKR